MSLTLVTAILKIYDIEYNEKRNGKNLEDRLNHFQSLVETGLPLVIYVSEIYKEAVEERCRGFDQVRLVVVELADTWTYREVVKWKEVIPAHRNVAKDTFEFLTLMTAKAEFMARTVDSNPFGSDKFAWVDFNVFHVLFNGFTSQEVLKGLNAATLKAEHRFVVPGCWDKRQALNRHNICWRFCGGFFLATAEGVKEFFALHQKHLGSAFDGMTWEVNFWAWLEKEAGWNPSWFRAGHDSTLIEIPQAFFDQAPESVTWLTKVDGVQGGTYDYPVLESYHPTSSSYIEFQGIPYLNVRYVNYLLTPQHLYIIHDPLHHLRTENLLLTLSEDRQSSIDSHFLKVVTDMPTFDDSIRGLEDIRLYEFAGDLRFIATQRQWSPSKQNRMIIGSVDLSENALTHMVLVEPPQPTGCEKNWIPLVHKGIEHFIYQWFPYQVTILENGRLKVVVEKPMPNLFGRIRGSTTFLEDGSERIGVVHYSEDRTPRHYYHMLIWLDKETLLPVARSQPFVFGRIGVEFCIGFTVCGDKLQFWYSQHDRDPVWQIVPRTAFSRFSLSS